MKDQIKFKKSKKTYIKPKVVVEDGSDKISDPLTDIITKLDFQR
jgi:hypothetical protein